MKKFVVAILIINSSCLFTSCDVARQLVIRTNNIKDSIAVYTNRNILPTTNRNDTNKIVIQIPIKDTLQKVFLYGFGNWSNAIISDYANNIDSIIIKNKHGNFELSDKTAIEAYLKSRRKGLFRNSMVIKSNYKK